MHALASVRREIGTRDPAARSTYLREFRQAFSKYQATLQPSELDHELASASVVLIGDYHALPASQRFAASLVESLSHEAAIVLAAEAILSRDQQTLDFWWRRETGEEELRRQLRFDREWGYPWQPFYELLLTARDHAEGIYGLDCLPRHDLRRIRSRDRHAAAKVRQIREQHPQSKIIVLFGESHLAPQHLPQRIRQALPEEKVLTVLQNLDSIYWQAAEAGASAVRVENAAVCVFNASPLEKYESYRICLERWNAEADEAPDFAPAVYNLIFSLARTLGFRLDSPRNGTQPKFLADSLPEVVSGSAAASVLNDRSCTYERQTNTLYIQEFKLADVATEAARFLYWACQGGREATPVAGAIPDTLARFGARLLCPEANFDWAAGNLGEELYAAYVQGRISKPTLRRLFLAHLDSAQAQQTMHQLSACVR
jgi:hypothetical protein